MESEIDWVCHPHTLRKPFQEGRKNEILGRHSVDTHFSTRQFQEPDRGNCSTPSSSIMPNILPPIPTNTFAKHPSSNTYFPPISPTRPRPKPTKLKLSDILLPRPTLRTTTSMPLLKPPTMAPEGDNEKQGRFGKLRKMGSDLLMKAGLKRSENWAEWEVVDAPEGSMSGRRRSYVQVDRGLENEKRTSRIPWPPSPSFECRVRGDDSNSTFDGFQCPTSFPSFTSFLEIPGGTWLERSGSETNSGSGEGSGWSSSREEFRTSTIEPFISSFPFPPTPMTRKQRSQQFSEDPPLPVDHPFNTGKTSKLSGTPRLPQGVHWREGIATGTPELPHTPPSTTQSPRSLITPRTPRTPRNQKLQSRQATQFLPITPSSSFSDGPSLDSNQLLSALSAVLYLRSVLYTHAASAQSLLESHAEVLPGFVYRSLSRQIDQWWTKWRSALNNMGAQTASALLHLSSPPPPPPSPLPLPIDPINSPIPQPLTHDSLQKLIWSLEEAGQVPSFTFARMFGKSAQVRLRKLEDDEVWEATRKGWREYQDDEWGCLQREMWRESGDIRIFGLAGRKGKKGVM
ncbi:hypothetical protein C359_03629 [Cryptococcus neoformans Bt120]|nr:hypothetical protein C360_04350 [Cryptococcus neoformans var. grubii Bt15]OXG39712.1 hypothetical protein C359_03629 [Cryptococcus neoformans var. grubii Bt120]